MQLPVLADGMLGDLMDLYKLIGQSTTDKKQELLVRPPLMDKVCINNCGWIVFQKAANTFVVSRLKCQSGATIFNSGLTSDSMYSV